EGRTVLSRNSIEVTSKDGTPHNQMMIAPGMIGSHDCAGPGRLERSSEIRERDRGHILRYVHFNGGVVKRLHGISDLYQEIVLRCHLILVGIKAPQRAEEDLPAQWRRRCLIKTNQLSD